jgi:hypothetical protein
MESERKGAKMPEKFDQYELLLFEVVGRDVGENRSHVEVMASTQESTEESLVQERRLLDLYRQRHQEDTVKTL